MPESLSFRDQQIAICRQRMITTRTEAVNLLTRARQQSVEVGTHKFGKPNILGKVSKNPLAARGRTIIEIFTQSGAKQYDPNAERPDWTQNPEYIARQFLDQVIEIFRREPVDDLMYAVEKCMADFKREYPHASPYIDHTEKTLMIKLMIEEIWNSRRLEENWTITLALYAHTASVRELVETQLNR
jgi:hypothetical protein